MASRSVLSEMARPALEGARALVMERGNPEVKAQIETYFPNVPSLNDLEGLAVFQSLIIGALGEMVDQQIAAAAPRRRGRPRKTQKES